MVIPLIPACVLAQQPGHQCVKIMWPVTMDQHASKRAPGLPLGTEAAIMTPSMDFDCLVVHVDGSQLDLPRT